VIHAYASRPHYFDHLEPIWKALPDELRGESFSPIPGNPWGSARPVRIPHDDLVLVASFVDSRKMARARAGQTYDGDERARCHGSYAGGDGHENTVLFLSPREEIAQRWRDTYYDVPSVAVGCPKLDRYAKGRGVNGEAQTVAFSFHWDNPLCPESRSAFGHYRRSLAGIIGALRERGWRVLGHGHPREIGHLARVWRELDVPIVMDQDYVMRHAAVLVADNTSALYEAAGIGIPVVCLNAPWYRRDVQHGLRFWDTLPGRQADCADDVIDEIERAVEYRRGDVLQREAAVSKTYAYRDGSATERAVRAILEVV
jgi:hypothetical protein